MGAKRTRALPKRRQDEISLSFAGASFVRLSHFDVSCRIISFAAASAVVAARRCQKHGCLTGELGTRGLRCRHYNAGISHSPEAPASR